MTEVESRDNRRAIILADVLEKTARTVQQQLISPRQQQQQQQQQQMTHIEDTMWNRPLSAPLVPLDETLGLDTDPLSMSYQAPPTNKWMYAAEGHQPPPFGARLTKNQPKMRGHIKVKRMTNTDEPLSVIKTLDRILTV